MRRSSYTLNAILVMGAGLCLTMTLGCDGKAKDLAKGSNLGDAVIGDGSGGTRTDGNDFGQIYNVTAIFPAQEGMTGVIDAHLPTNRPKRSFGNTTQNSQWPFEFIFTYPPNNFKLNEAHLVLVASRDNTDTEAIFMDGIISGRPPDSDMHASPIVKQRLNYCASGCNGQGGTNTNRYIMDFSLTHYKIGALNSFDLDLAALISGATGAVSVRSLVSDGTVQVALFDDLAVMGSGAQSSAPLLFIDGVTVSKTALSCTPSPVYKFINTYIHNDSNSVGNAFSGTTYTPFTSWGTMGSHGQNVEFHFDPKLPRITSLNDLNLNAASLSLQINRAASGPSAIVINGIGISQPGFDRTKATSLVESWDDTTTTNAAFTSFLAGVPAGTTSIQTINLINLLGGSRIKTLLGQGKFNVSFSGAIARVYGQAPHGNRTYGVAVAGPELYMQGDYTTQICVIPDNPNSPINDNFSGGDAGSCALDQSSPVVSSIQATNITANTATIQWLSNENSDSRVDYGLTGPGPGVQSDTNMVSFRSLQLTGLQPYRYYQYTVKSKDACGNETTSSIKTFRTLR